MEGLQKNLQKGEKMSGECLVQASISIFLNLPSHSQNYRRITVMEGLQKNFQKEEKVAGEWFGAGGIYQRDYRRVIEELQKEERSGLVQASISIFSNLPSHSQNYRRVIEDQRGYRRVMEEFIERGKEWFGAGIHLHFLESPSTTLSTLRGRIPTLFP